MCKALGAIMHDSEMLNEFVQKDKNLAKKILKDLHDLIVKINAWASGKAKISAEQKKTFSELEKELRALEGILHEALNKQARMHEGVENRIDKSNEKLYNKNDDTRYSYAGAKAKTANLQKLSKAEQMLKDGVSEEQIYKETGWFKGKDGLWRFEITNDMSVSEYVFPQTAKNTTIGEIYKNKLLYDAYPQLKNTPVIFLDKHPITGEEFMDGAFSESENTFCFSKNMTDSERLAQNEEYYRSVIIHEIQHAVQAIEGFDGGDNSLNALEYMREKAREELGKRGDEEFKRLLWSGEEKLNAYLDDFIVKSWGVKSIDRAVYEMRKTKPGEAEAMDADERKYLTASERRNKYPKYNERVITRDNFEEGLSSFSEGSISGGIQQIEKTGAYIGEYRNQGRIRKNSDSGLVKGEQSYLQKRQEGQGRLTDERFDLADEVDNNSSNEGYNVAIGNNESDLIDDAVCVIPRQDIVFVDTYRSLVRKKGFKEKLLKAKQGDLNAAKELLDAYITKEYIGTIKKKYSDAILVPVIGHQDITENELPSTLAKAISILIDAPTYEKIYKLTSNNMKSKVSNVRLTSKMDFDFYEDGMQKDIAGKHFVLVDDVVSTGTTLTALRDFIRSHGGVVDGYIALAKGKDNSDNMAILPQQLKKLVKITKQEYIEVLEKITEEELYGVFKELTARQAETTIRHPGIIGKILDERGRRGYVPENQGKNGLADRKYAGHVTEKEKRTGGMGEKSKIESDERFDLADDWNEKTNEFGTVPKGEKPARNIDVPNKIRRDRPISRFARTMMEAGVTPDDAISEFEQAILDGTMTHEVITDKAAETKAVVEIKHEGFKESLDAWDVLVRKGKIGKEDNGFNGILRLR